MQAIEEIRRDLGSLRHRRQVAMGTYVALLVVFCVIYLLRPTGPNALTRDTGWTVAFGLLLVGSLLGAMVTIGYPLISRVAVYVVSAVMTAGCLLALAVTMDTSAGPAPMGAGMSCFMYGTAISAGAMLALGIISGRVWRRFPDPGFPLALGMTGVGLAALHMHCGGIDPVHLFGFHLTPLLVVFALAHFAVRTRNDLSRDG